MAGEGGKWALPQLKCSKWGLGSNKLKNFAVAGSGLSQGQVPKAGKGMLEHFDAVCSHDTAQGALQTSLITKKIAN